MNRVIVEIEGQENLTLEMDGVPSVGDHVSILNVGGGIVEKVLWVAMGSAAEGPFYAYLTLKAPS